MLTILKGDLEK